MILISLCFTLICKVYGIELNSLKFLTCFPYSCRNKKSMRDSRIQGTQRDYQSPVQKLRVLFYFLRSQNTTFRWFKQQKSVFTLLVPRSPRLRCWQGGFSLGPLCVANKWLPYCLCSQPLVSPLRAGFPDTSLCSDFLF